jgi:hypothetical protein
MPYIEVHNFLYFSFFSVEEKEKIESFFRGHIQRGKKPPTKEEAVQFIATSGLDHLHWRKVKEAVWYKSQQTIKKSKKAKPVAE